MFSFLIAVDAWLRYYAFALPCALLPTTDILLYLLYFRFAASRQIGVHLQTAWDVPGF